MTRVPSGIHYPCVNDLTVAWRSVLLPARCFTRTVNAGWYHLTSTIRELFNAAQDLSSLFRQMIAPAMP